MLVIEWMLMALCGTAMAAFGAWVWQTAEDEAALPIEPDPLLLAALARHRGWASA